MRSMPGIPEFGFVSDISDDRLAISKSRVSTGSNTLSIPAPQVQNNTGVSLAKGDKIFYIREEKQGNSHVIIKEVIARNMLIVSTVEELMTHTKIRLTCGNDVEVDLQELQRLLTGFLGISLNLTEITSPDIILRIVGEDPGAKHCPLSPIEFFENKTHPLTINVPFVSDKTILYLRRVSEMSLTDTQLKMTVLALRIIHLVLHTLGHMEHFDSSLPTNLEAQRRGDPELAKKNLEKECLMSWNQVHLIASQLEYAKRIRIFNEHPICDECASHCLNGFEPGYFADLGKVLEKFSQHKKQEPYTYPIYFVLYVLEKRKQEVIFGGSLVYSSVGMNATGITSTDLSDGLAKGFHISVPYRLFNPPSARIIKRGMKLLVEFDYALNSSRNARLSVVTVLDQIREGCRIDKTSSLVHKLGVRRLQLTVRIRWASGVDTEVLRQAAAKVKKLTGWKVIINQGSDEQLNSASSRMLEVINGLKSDESHDEFRRVIYDLQDIINGISPTGADIVDTSIVDIFVLPELRCQLPISTLGHTAQGQTALGIYSVIVLPAAYGPFKLGSEACKDCSKNSTVGKNYERCDLIALLIIHELLHVTAYLKDHCGECGICTYNDPKMKALRFIKCDICIQENGNVVHRNCAMSYACLLCIAARLDETRSLKDVLCEACCSATRPDDYYIHDYIRRVNYFVYGAKIAEINLKRTSKRFGLDKQTDSEHLGLSQ